MQILASKNDKSPERTDLVVLFILFAVVSFGAAILQKLNDKAGNCDQQDYVHEATFAKHKFGDKPDGDENRSDDPEHKESCFKLRGYRRCASVSTVRTFMDLQSTQPRLIAGN